MEEKSLKPSAASGTNAAKRKPENLSLKSSAKSPAGESPLLSPLNSPSGLKRSSTRKINMTITRALDRIGIGNIKAWSSANELSDSGDANQVDDTIMPISSSKTIGPKLPTVPSYESRSASATSVIGMLGPSSRIRSDNCLTDHAKRKESAQSDGRTVIREGSSTSVVFNQDFLKKKTLRDPPILKRQEAFLFGSSEPIQIPDSLSSLNDSSETGPNIINRSVSSSLYVEDTPVLFSQYQLNQIQEEPSSLDASIDTIDDPAASTSPYKMNSKEIESENTIRVKRSSSLK